MLHLNHAQAPALREFYELTINFRAPSESPRRSSPYLVVMGFWFCLMTHFVLYVEVLPAM